MKGIYVLELMVQGPGSLIAECNLDDMAMKYQNHPKRLKAINPTITLLHAMTIPSCLLNN